MDYLAKELCDDAWNQICFAQKKIDDAKRSLRDAGAPPNDLSFKLIEEALRNLSEANRAVVDFKLPKGEPKKVGRTCGDCNHSCNSYVTGMRICLRDKDRAPIKFTEPACEHFELSLRSLEKALEDALCKSRKERPNFVPQHILFAAAYDFLVEISTGDFSQLLKKAGEITAILYRTLNGDGEKKESKK